jgi:hypothetical protein
MIPEEAKQKFSRDGWCVVPDVLTPAEAQYARERLWLAAEENRRRGIATSHPIVDPNEQNVRILNLMDVDPLFRTLIRHPVALELAGMALGSDIMISSFNSNIARPGARSMKVHSDQGLVVPGPWMEPWCINVIWCFSDVRKENGGTLYLPGSHRYQTKGEVPADAMDRMVAFEATAGSLVAMDGRMWHTSGANITEDEDRLIAFGFYSRSFLRPQWDPYSIFSAKTLAGLDHEMRVLLGLEGVGNLALSSQIYRDEALAAGVVQGPMRQNTDPALETAG